MISRPVSNTGIEVSPLCLGTMTFGNPVGRREAIGLVHWALDHGINFFDTADMYEGYNRYMGSPVGVAERILGEALQDRRERAVVTTKVGNPIGGTYKGTGLGRVHMLHQIDVSLDRLRTDYIDFYELHKYDPDTPIEESVATMAELIECGKVRQWGFSNFSPDHIQQMLEICARNGWPRPVIAQPLYNWLERDSEIEYIPRCRKRNIAVTPYQPLQGGLLTGKYREGEALPAGSRAAEHPQWLSIDGNPLLERCATFEEESAAAGLRPSQYAMHWLLSQPGVTAVIVGVKRIEQLQDLLEGCGQP